MDDIEFIEDDDDLKCIHHIPLKHSLNSDRSPKIGPQNVSGQSHSWFESVIHKEEDCDDDASCLEDKLDASEGEQESGVRVDLSADLLNSNCEVEFILPECNEDKDSKKDRGDGYRCSHCHAKFRRKAALQTHVLSHLEVRDCKECNYRAVNKIDLDAHLLDDHSFADPCKLKSDKTFSRNFLSKFFQCPKCPYKSNRKWNVTTHLKRHSRLSSSQKGNYKFLRNDFATLKAPSLDNGHFLELEESHTSLAKGSNPIISKENSFASSSFTIFKENQTANNEQVRTSTSFLETNVLGEMQSCSTSASVHVTSYDQEENSNVNDFLITSEEDETKIDLNSDLEKPVLLKCIECSFTTTEHFLLKEHISNHPGMKLFNCARCNFSTDQERHFNSHILSHSSVEVFKCNRCDFVTNRNSSLHDHTLSHDSSSVYKCDHCAFTTRIYKNLKSHQIIHSNEEIFKCSECDYESNIEKYLKIHSLVHSPEEQQFKCSECSYKTPRKGQLKIHALKHSNIKLYSCPTCDFKTNRRCSLKVHSLSHSSKKLYKCSICSYDSNQKLLLRLHVLNHLNIKLHKCPHCDYATNHSSHFKRHFRKHI